jgi:hypothetical protein
MKQTITILESLKLNMRINNRLYYNLKNNYLHKFTKEEFNAINTIIEMNNPKPVIRFNNYNHEWWAGKCPNCGKIITFDYSCIDRDNPIWNTEKLQYCTSCGQLCDFTDIKEEGQ